MKSSIRNVCYDNVYMQATLLYSIYQTFLYRASGCDLQFISYVCKRDKRQLEFFYWLDTLLLCLSIVFQLFCANLEPELNNKYVLAQKRNCFE